VTLRILRGYFCALIIMFCYVLVSSVRRFPCRAPGPVRVQVHAAVTPEQPPIARVHLMDGT
jgi:hypothetical protein